MARTEATQRCEALLPIAEELDHVGDRCRYVPTRPKYWFSEQRTSDRVAVLERVHQASDLLTVSDEATLELGKLCLPGVDAVGDVAELHRRPP